MFVPCRHFLVCSCVLTTQKEKLISILSAKQLMTDENLLKTNPPVVCNQEMPVGIKHKNELDS